MKAKSIVVDVTVDNEGTIFLFHLLTEAAELWVAENTTGDETTFFGNALVVEHRYASDLAYGMHRDGLVVE